MAMIITAGTKYRAILSASCCTGALVAWARATIAAICESTVSAPTWVARITQPPLSSTVAPVTGSPAVLETGLDSPVIIDSSIRASPATITPSVGTRSPFLTTSRSPVAMASMSVSVKCAGLRHSMPSTWSAEVALSLCAVRGRSLISDCTALPVPSRALVSSRRPTSTRVMTTPTDSKYGSREPSGNTRRGDAGHQRIQVGGRMCPARPASSCRGSGAPARGSRPCGSDARSRTSPA